MMKITECNKCKEAVIWAKSKKTGSNMMFDAEPGGTTSYHKWQLFEDEGVIKAEFVGGGGDDLRSSHFDTCSAKDGGGPKRQASETRRAAPETTRRATAEPTVFRSVTVEPGALEVTVRFGNMTYVGTCRLETQKSDADDSVENVPDL